MDELTRVAQGLAGLAAAPAARTGGSSTATGGGIASSGAFTGEGGGLGSEDASLQDSADTARAAGTVRSPSRSALPDAMPADAGSGNAAAGGANAGSSRDQTVSGDGASPTPDPSDASKAADASGVRRSSADAAQESTTDDAQDSPLDIPEPVTSAEDEADPSMPETLPASSPLAPLLGHWIQLDASSRGSDFAPGGHDLSLLAIRPTQRSLQVYRAWGTPPVLVVAAELRATFDPQGGVHLQESPSQPSRFFTSPIPLPVAAGAPPRTATPPERALPLDTAWSIEPDGSLRLDGRTYRRIDRAEFERLSRARAAAPIQPPAPITGPTSGAAEPSGGVDFFGARVRGRYVCFVCDISGSMAGDKMEALRREIIRTAQALPAGAHYQVVFFDHSAHVLTSGWTRAGTPESQALLRKVDNVGVGGGTDPLDALAYAFTRLDPPPHELFLLTDGNFGRDPDELLRRLNGGLDRTRIHTLGMGDDASEEVLRAIATAHGGTYTHVPAAPSIPGPLWTPGTMPGP